MTDKTSIITLEEHERLISKVDQLQKQMSRISFAMLTPVDPIGEDHPEWTPTYELVRAYYKRLHRADAALTQIGVLVYESGSGPSSHDSKMLLIMESELKELRRKAGEWDRKEAGLSAREPEKL